MTIEWALGLTITILIIIFYFFIVRYLILNEKSPLLIGTCFGIYFFYLAPLTILYTTGSFNKGIFLAVTSLVNIDASRDLEPVLLMFALLLSMAFAILFIAKGGVNDFCKPNSLDNEIDSNLLWRILIISSVLYMIFAGYDILSNNILSGDAHWYESRHESMSVENGSIINVLFTYLRNVARTVFFGTLICAWYRKLFRHDLLFFAIYIITVALDIYMSGNRFILAATAILIGYLLLVRKKYFFISMCSILVFPVAWLGTIFMSVRGVMYSNSGSFSELVSLFKDKSSEANDQLIFVLTNMVEGINFNTFVSIFYDAPKRLPFLWGETFLTPFVFWIPRSIWEDKPPRVGQFIGEAYTGNSDLSIVATFFGETWLNFGYAAVLFVPVLFLVAFIFINALLKHLPYEIRSMVLFIIGFSMMRASYGSIFIDVLVMSFLISLIMLFTTKRAYFLGFKIKI